MTQQQFYGSIKNSLKELCVTIKGNDDTRKVGTKERELHSPCNRPDLQIVITSGNMFFEEKEEAVLVTA